MWLLRSTALYCVFSLATYFHSAQAQSPSTASQTASASASSIRYVTTTILTTIAPTSSGASPTTSSLVLTLALNSTSSTNSSVSIDHSTNTTTVISASNATYPVGTVIYSNSTVLFPNTTVLFPNGTYLLPNGTELAANGTILNPNTEFWNGTQEYLPFKIRIDAAYGVAGGFLVLTGIPLAVLGGKNRWSSMAVVSGYVVLLFTLVIILRFGVSPGISQSPTPNPPSTTLRGLYTLACIIASFIGAGAGVFFYNQTKYLVPAMGGFALGWFIEACKDNGATGGSIVGRWGLIGGFTVVFFIAGLISTFHYHLILTSTAFIGATAFILGIDCFTRAGLKEFYIYNLGFRNGLFPKLWVQEEGSVGEWKFPLLTIMQVEIGVLIAVFLIGTAIQYRILGMLQVKMEQIKQEDAERKEAEEEARAASRFKEHDADLEKWESKYGVNKGLGGSGDVPLATLAKDMSASSQNLMRPHTRADSGFSHDLQLDTRSLGGQSIGRLPVMALGGSISPALGEDGRVQSPHSQTETSAEERERLRLLDEISEVKKSIEVLRSTTPTSVELLSTSGDWNAGTRSRTQSGLSMGSFASGLGGGSSVRNGQPSPTTALTPTAADVARSKKDKEWDDYLADRKLFTPPAGVSPAIEASVTQPRNSIGRLSKIPDSVVQAMNRRERTLSAYELGASDFEREEITQPMSAALPLENRRSVQNLGEARISDARLSDQNDRGFSYSQHRSSAAPLITGHAHSDPSRRESSGGPSRPSAVERTITHEELTTRHRNKLAQLQRPITDSMQDEIRLTEARAKYEKQKETERRDMARKEAERAKRSSTAPALRPDAAPDIRHVPRESGVDRAAQWRQSLAAEHLISEQPRAHAYRNKREDQRTDRRDSRGPNQYVN